MGVRADGLADGLVGGHPRNRLIKPRQNTYRLFCKTEYPPPPWEQGRLILGRVWDFLKMIVFPMRVHRVFDCFKLRRKFRVSVGVLGGPFSMLILHANIAENGLILPCSMLPRTIF